MEIQQNLTRVNLNVKQGRDIRYIVIHYTGNRNDTAYNNTKYFKDVDRGSSAHYFVDKNSIWQCVQDKDVAWHCGAKAYRHKACRNSNSIGVELCDGVPDFDKETLSNGAWLVRELMKKYDIPIENILRHYDVTGKLCPASMINEGKWESFLKLLEVEDMQKFDEYVEHTNEIINTMGKEIKALQDIINIMGKEIAELKERVKNEKMD